MSNEAERLLIVDDSADNRDLFARRFERLGYVVQQAESGPRALEMIAQGAPDMVLLDVTMPDMDGLEVLQRIRLTHSMAELPVVMVTARATTDDVVQALELGANDYVTKPIDMSVAKARIVAQLARKRAEDASRRAQRDLEEMVERLKVAVADSEAASKAKSEFLSNMSHEIRTPLNGVLGMAQLMAIGDLDRVQRERLAIISRSGEALLAILNDVLDLAKIEAGKMRLQPTDFHPGDVADDIAGLFGEAARCKGLTLHVETHPSAGGQRRGDPARVRQIASNLVSNAVKFTERGEVRLTLKGETADGVGVLHMIVSDTGIGIAPDKMRLLFDKFTQLDGSSTRKFGGTGLGLALCRDLADLMGGRMWAESQEGRGSTFHFMAPLPVVDETRPSPATRRAPLPA